MATKTARKSSRKATQAATPQGPFYVMTDDAAMKWDGTYCTMHYIARRGEGECGYAPSESYAEIASDVEDMNAMYARGEIQ